MFTKGDNYDMNSWQQELLVMFETHYVDVLHPFAVTHVL